MRCEVKVYCVACGSDHVHETGNDEALVEVSGVMEKGTEYKCQECDCIWTE